MNQRKILMMSLKTNLGWIALIAALVLAGETALAQSGRSVEGGATPPTKAPKAEQILAKPALTNASVAVGYAPISFETLASFPIKVDWLVNATNSNFDTLRRDGTIPDDIKLLHGRKVALQGFMKPLKQDAGGVTEFLLMRDHALCCQTNVPQINEWVHVRMSGKSLPFAHERQFTVRGVLQVGELRGAGNVASIYRLTGDEITPTDAH